MSRAFFVTLICSKLLHDIVQVLSKLTAPDNHIPVDKKQRRGQILVILLKGVMCDDHA